MSMEFGSSLRLVFAHRARTVFLAFQRVFLACFVGFLRLLSTEPAQCGQPQEADAAVTSNDSPQSAEPARRASPAPLDGVFPGSDYLGSTPLIGVPDTDPGYPLTKAVWAVAPPLVGARQLLVHSLIDVHLRLLHADGHYSSDKVERALVCAVRSPCRRRYRSLECRRASHRPGDGSVGLEKQ